MLCFFGCRPGTYGKGDHRATVCGLSDGHSRGGESTVIRAQPQEEKRMVAYRAFVEAVLVQRAFSTAVPLGKCALGGHSAGLMGNCVAGCRSPPTR